MSYLIKIAISSLVIVAASEIAKKSSLFGAIVIAVPITSILAMIFLYYDTRDMAKVSDFAAAVPVAVLPSFLFFFAFIGLAKYEVGFVVALAVSTAMMLALYGIYMYFAG